MTLLYFFLIALAALLLAGATFQLIGGARDAKKYPPPGRMIRAGSHRLHALEMGEGAPAVIFEAALGATSRSWALVQAEIAKLTRTVAYDRAGFGWSDRGPLPRTASRVVDELRAMLREAAIPPPYVLVGHSFGGLVMHLFAAKHREEVAGLVLVDAPFPREWIELSPLNRRKLMGGAFLCRRGVWFCRFGVGRLIARLATRGARKSARNTVTLITYGLLRGHEDRLLAPLWRLPPELRGPLQMFWTQPKFYEALASQMQHMPASAREAESAGALGDIPLVVLTAGNPTPQRAAQQEAMARLATRGEHRISTESGHWIQLDDPALVIAAIRDVLVAAQTQRSNATADKRG
ncbi:MAG: alpha/beta fold hydrolase [Candidatus Acidiferrales bacterium]